jgi:gliding motility-associated-like protein
MTLRISLRKLVVFKVALLSLLLSGTFAQTTEIYNSPGSGVWTVPCGVNSITVEIWGGGGAGGGSTGQGGGGGGAACYNSHTIAVSTGQNFSYTVGSGGIAILGLNGGNGQTSSFGIFSSGGGQGGSAGSVSPGNAGFGCTIGLSNGANGSNGSPTNGGNGGASPNGGSGGLGGGLSGSAGQIPGAGGGGAIFDGIAQGIGGNGAVGQIRITYNQSPAAPTISAGGPLSFCSGGSVTLISSAAPSYLWSNGATSQSINVNSSGSYSVSITDLGCTVGSLAVGVAVNPIPTAPVIDSFSQPNCNQPGIVYFSGLPTGNWTITESLNGGFVNGTGTTGIFPNLDQGTYAFTATSDSGCISIPSLPVTLNPPVQGPVLEISFDNVYCFGDSTGFITVTIAGGTDPVNFVWSNGVTTLNQFNLGAGTYSITATDAIGCSITSVIEITQPASALSVTLSGNNVLCFGDPGYAFALATGGTPGYFYNWSNGELTAALNNLSGGVYTVTVSDAFACEEIASITITEPTSPLLLNLNSQTNIVCFGQQGSATVSAFGGTGSYFYDWSDGQSGPTANGLTAGVYTVSVSDDNNCVSTRSITITGPSSALNSNIIGQTNVLCFGLNTGAVGVSTTGGTSPYSFNWSNGSTTASITGLSAGNYTLTVSDANTCTLTRTVTITQPSAALSAIFNAGGVLCFGQSDGFVSATASGGTGSYNYSWSNGATGSSLSGLTAGIYTLTLSDANSCSIVSSATVTGPTQPLSISVQSQNNVICFGDLGSATVSATGGIGSYFFDWSDGQAGNTASNLTAGVYTASVTDDNSCSAAVNVTISGPSAVLSASINSQTNILCFGSATGTATVGTAGGSGSFNYLWSNGQTALTATGLSAGNHRVTVSDANGCTASSVASVTISGPSSALNAVISAQTNNLCFGSSSGTATLTAGGGSGAYNYIWSNGQTNAIANNLSTGTHRVTVSDANGCTSTLLATVTISGPSEALSTSITSQTNNICFGSASGAATVTASGGSGAYNYIWSNGQTVSSANNLPSGTYGITVSDANGCTLNSIATVTISGPSTALNASISAQSNNLCFGSNNGTATVTAGGGSGAYNYIWSNGQTNTTANNLPTGTHRITVSDANGCTVNSIATVTISGPSAALSASISAQSNNLCFGNSVGTATVTAIGGSGAYNYLWSNGQTNGSANNLSTGIHRVTVSDANGCTVNSIATVTISGPSTALSANISAQTNNLCFGTSNGTATVSVSGGSASYGYLWSNGQTGSTAIALASGVHRVTVSDNNGCTLNALASVTISGPSTAVSSALISQTNVLCFGESSGIATVLASGGSGNYTYLWNSSPPQFSSTANGLPAGVYRVTVSDINGCTVSSQTSVTITSPSAPLSAFVIAQTNVLCAGLNIGSATISAAGGSNNYNYNWNTSPAQTTQTASGLGVGSYNATVSDANGCTTTVVGLNVVVNGPTVPLSSNATGTNVLCFGSNSGVATVTANGGTGNYSYLWNTGNTTSSISGLPVGTYSVLVSDANGCTVNSISTVTISGPSAALSASIGSQNNVLCFGQNSGSIISNINGGSGLYNYLWSNGSTSANISGLPAGVYSLTATDRNGCTSSVSASVTLSSPSTALNASLSTQNNVNCFGQTTGAATINVSGGTGSYNFNWSNGATSQNISGLSTGTYTVTISDQNGCTLSPTVSVNISGPSGPINASISGQTNVLCFAQSNGTATAIAIGGSGAYNYTWSTIPAQNQAQATGLAAGSYTVTVTDANGCTVGSTSSVIINQPLNILTAAVNTQSNVSCVGLSDGTAIASASGGTGLYNFLWSNGETNAAIAGLAAAVYSVTVSDANNCSSNSSVTITAPVSAPTVSVVIQNDVLCFGQSTGSIQAAAVGGSGGYIFQWSNGATSGLLNNLSAGTYRVTLTDNNGCRTIDSIEILQPASALNLNLLSTVNVNCFGASNGAADMSVSGATAPYSFLWSNAATSEDISGLSAGVYTLTVTDNNICTATLSVNISQSAQVAAPTVDSVIQTSCSVSVGSVVLSGLPAGNWTLTQLPANTTINGNGPFTVISGLSPGIYNFSVTNASGCSSALSVNATINSQNSLDCDGDGVNNGTEITDGTDPFNPCNYVQLSVNMVQGGLWSQADCDGDGVRNTNENNDLTNVFDPCSYLASSITLAPAASWNILDCDGDGVINGTESADGTNPLNPCSYILFNVTLPQSTAWSALDCDGDGVSNATEIANGTDYFNPCNFLLSSVTLPASTAWNNADCDGDGVINGTEISDATNPLIPCSFNPSSITLPTGGQWNNSDCDGDGVTNQTEVSDATNPYNYCSYIASSVTQVQGGAFNAADCDGDGVTNATEITDGTAVLNPCNFVLSSVTLVPSASWNVLDCDGDGVINASEIADATNPLNPCSYLLPSVTLSQAGPWLNADCDGDGVINASEISDATNPLNPCSYLQGSITLAPSVAWNALDCDGDGVINSTEIADGTNVNNPCSFNPASITLSQGGLWNTVDCDGDGVTNGIEISDLTNPADPCSFVSSSISLPPSNQWNIADCDGDGVINGTEISDGTDPEDPCSINTSSITLSPGGDWNAEDCDGDGVINMTELADTTNPYDPCSFLFPSITILPTVGWAGLDCDGDGVSNGNEALDATDPEDPCSYEPISVTLLPSAVWNNADCDGDGVPNAVEISDSTNPLNPCSYNVSNVTLPQGQLWQQSDCDSDGVLNLSELTGLTDPLDPCSYDSSDVTETQGALWAAADCDGDGVVNADERDDNTNIFDPCSFVLASQSLTPSVEWSGEDCDNDGFTNAAEIAQSSDPLDPCSPISCEMNVPEGFSPNGDGVNDNYVIRGLQIHPDNKFTVFNRWGNLVFKSEPYRNDWDGTSSFGLNIGGDKLPTGVYYYILDLGDGSKPMKGYIYLNRENN